MENEENPKKEVHKAKAHSVNSEIKDRKLENNTLDKMRTNPWMITSIVLAVLLVLLVIFNGNLSGGKGIVSGKTAAQNVVDYINSNTQSETKAEVISFKQEGQLYSVVIKMNNQEMPVYVTLDGKNVILQSFPLDNEISEQPEKESTPAEVPKNDKPVIELFVMSYCPYGTQIEKGIIPVIETLKDKVDFKLKFVNYAMHGKQEIDDNTRQYCIQKTQPTKLLPYLKCFLSQQGKSDVCLTETGIDKTKVDSCVKEADKLYNITTNYQDKTTWLSGQFPLYLVENADNEKYNVQGSPTLIINGADASSARDPASLLKVVCSAYKSVPSECSTTLSSETPSPGFGFTTDASGGDSAAQCG